MPTHWSRCGRGPRTLGWLPASAGILRCNRHCDTSLFPLSDKQELADGLESRCMCTVCSMPNCQICTKLPFQSTAHPTRAHVHVHTLVNPLISPCPLRQLGDPRPPSHSRRPPSTTRQLTCERVNASLLIQSGRLALDALFVLPVPALDEVCLRLQGLRVDA